MVWNLLLQDGSEGPPLIDYSVTQKSRMSPALLLMAHPKLRIAKGVSQTELALRLGVSKQVVHRYEESDYQTVAISSLQEILGAIGIKAVITLTA